MALTDKLSAIGDAIRAKTGKGEKLTLDQMPSEIAEISGSALGALHATQNGIYKPTYEAATVTWDENTEYDGTLDVDGIPLRYKKAENLTVPDDVSALNNPEYCFRVTLPDGTVQSFPLGDIGLGSADGVYLANDISFAVVWVKDATFVNAGYGASLENNTVYVTDYLWLAHGGEYAGASFSLTAQGQKLDGFSSVTVEVESTGGGLAINGIIEQYKVNAGATVNAGDFVEFVNKCGSGTFAGSTTFSDFGLSACKLDNSRVLVAYSAASDSNYGKAVVLTLDDTGVTVGTTVTFNTAQTSYISAVALSASKAVVAYSNGGSSSRGIAKLLTIDGTTITAGASISLTTRNATYISTVALSEERGIVFYSDYADSPTSLKASLFSVKDDTLTIVNSTVIATTVGLYVSAVALSENRVFITYESGSSPYACYSRVLLISNESISVGAGVELNQGSYDGYRAVAKLTENKVLCTYGPGDTGIAYLLTTDEGGTTITLETSFTFKSSACNYVSAVGLSENKVLVTYRDNTNSYYGTAIVLTIDGTTITAGEETVYSLINTLGPNIVTFSSSSALVVYFTSSAGLYTGLTIDGTTITVDGLGKYVQPATGRLHNVGVAATSGAEGETVDVYVVG